ncbi:MAG: hypothetical protein ACR2P0_13770 [Acidimicrobiales bacterium]
MITPSHRPDLVVEGLLHPGEVDRFTAFCVETSREDLKGLRLRVIAYLASLVRLADGDPHIDVELARRIGSTLAHVLDDPVDLDETDRALLRGGVEYFLLTDDDEGDMAANGFDDDRRVVNRVLEALGRIDLLLD